ncbi:MAG: bifunctional DNA-formamidopyrimidine glycosylase/DNA-(apurinic or apyrimidinic site) lyase [Anaerolineae bacterium]|nr:bifunctional DNA-formamidopyrimidine glycosylase/DNA-(apurinic or apyrimidinic site) lyase [Anaerolineae bacterium]
MPELPEVETVARGLHQCLPGSTITAAAIYWPRTLARPALDEFQARIAGRRVESVARRGKYLVIKLDQGYLLVHLKMSGRLFVALAGEALGPHIRAVLDLDDDRQLRFRDARKFGRIYLVGEPEEITATLGPEPLAADFSQEDFSRLLGRRSGRLKSMLLNQQFLAGVGNIYADEILFAARLNPLRRVDTLTAADQVRLYEAIRAVLQRAIVACGTTLPDRNYLDAEGRAGDYQVEVYGRTGDPCPVCGVPIERLIVGGRSTHFCPKCQR